MWKNTHPGKPPNRKLRNTGQSITNTFLNMQLSYKKLRVVKGRQWRGMKRDLEKEAETKTGCPGLICQSPFKFSLKTVYINIEYLVTLSCFSHAPAWGIRWQRTITLTVFLCNVYREWYSNILASHGASLRKLSVSIWILLMVLMKNDVLKWGKCVFA